MSTIAQLAREHDVMPSLVGYIPPADDDKTITAPADHPHGEYGEGDAVDPFDMSNAHLRIASAYRTAGGYISAEAKRAQAELTRRAANRPAKKQRHNLAVAALLEAGLLEVD